MRATEIFRPEAAAPAAARSFARVVLGDRACRADAELVVSELVSNVVLHAVGAGSIEVEIQGDDGLVRIEVTQLGGPRAVPDIESAPTWPTAAEYTGRGLRIVDLLAERWGVDGDGRTTVWCELIC